MFSTNTIVIAPEWQALLQATGLDSVGAIYAYDGGTKAIPGKATELRRIVLTNDGQTATLFVKKYWYPTPRLRWSGFYRGIFFGWSKVHREFENLRRLRAWGLDAPSPVAYAEERRGRWLWRSVLISESVAQPVSLDLFIRDQRPGKTGRRDLIDRLAAYTRRMHEHRFVHHDYFWRNILLSGGALDHFYLIDSHKGRQWRWGGQAARAKDLATLDAPAPAFFRRTERLRFFLRYAGHERLTAADKKLLRRVLRVAAPLREAQLRRVNTAKPFNH
jgi:tRNA A-37 threonylcarbamoyl transferase component Bud32